MLERVLVPVDGSQFAEVAVPVAVEIGRRSGAQVDFTLVHEPQIRGMPSPDGALLTAEEAPARREREAGYLDQLSARFGGAGHHLTRTIVDGLAATALTDRVAEWKPSLVVMATHGRGPISRWWLGSVADYLIRHVVAPILLIRPKDEVDWPAPDLHLRSILVPMDLSAAAEAILAPVIELAKLFGSSVELVHVVEPMIALNPAGFPYPVPPNIEFIEQDKTEAQRRLAVQAARLADQNIPVTTKVEFGPNVAAALLELADQDHCDLVALGTHGVSGLRRALIGGVADKLIRGTGRPILVIRPESYDS